MHCNNVILDAHISDKISAPSPSIELTKDTNEQIRRDSLLFEEVSQGLVKLDTTGPKVEDKCEQYNLSLGTFNLAIVSYNKFDFQLDYYRLNRLEPLHLVLRNSRKHCNETNERNASRNLRRKKNSS